MGWIEKGEHAVCVPFPAQGHINPMMHLAKLLHFRGFHITFVLTEYNRGRILRSRGPHALDGLPSFRFVSIPDGLPPSDADATQDVPALCDSLDRNCLAPFTDLLVSLNKCGGHPAVTCIVSDSVASFTFDAANRLGINEVFFWTASACGYLGYQQYARIHQQGLFPIKDSRHLDTELEWVVGMKGIRLKDIPSFIRSTDPNDIMVKYMIKTMERSRKASAIIFNTFDALEHDFLVSLAPIFPPLYPIGPIHTLIEKNINSEEEIESIRCNLWKEDKRCIEWLDSKEPASVVYVNFGSITVMTNAQMTEFAFGLSNSGKHFLWVVRPDLVTGESAVLPREFVEETKGRSLLVDWCDQQRVLSHIAVGGFLTHGGWNSTLESVCCGVPMIVWPFFAEQQTNCWACCNVWGIGMEIDSDVKRENVEMQVRELMDGDKGKEMRMKTFEFKFLADLAVAKGTGDSFKNLDKLITQLKN